MLGLVKHDVVRARYGHHDHESVPGHLVWRSRARRSSSTSSVT
jgi:hypothetical protein